MMKNYTNYLQTITVVSHILYYQSPLMSLVIGKTKDLFVYIWVDSDKQNRTSQWLIFSVSPENVKQYFEKTISQYVFIERAVQNNFVSERYLVVSIDEKLNYSNPKALSFSQLPEEFLPTKDLFFDETCAGDNGWQEWLNQNEANINNEVSIWGLELINNIIQIQKENADLKEENTNLKKEIANLKKQLESISYPKTDILHQFPTQNYKQNEQGNPSTSR